MDDREASAAGDDSKFREMRGSKLADFGKVGELEFTDSRGRKFTQENLLGRVTIVDFFYTTCRGPCMELTAKMRSLAAALATEEDAQIVSVSVDSNTDTPDVLARHARANGGESPRWHWLTGDREQVKKLATQFMAAFGDKDDAGDISHSTRIHVIDRDGHLRAIHDTQLPDEWREATLHSVRIALATPAGSAAPTSE